MVAIAARAPAFFRTVYHAISGGGKRKRDDSTHTALQPSSGMSPPQRMGLNLFNKRPRTQGCLDDEVRPYALPSLRYPFSCLTLACHRRAGAGNCAESAATRSAGDAWPAPTQAAQRGTEVPAILVSALQPPQLERQPVGDDTGGTPLTDACDTADSRL